MQLREVATVPPFTVFHEKDDFYMRILSFTLGIVGLLGSEIAPAQSIYSQWLSKTDGSVAESALSVAPALAEATNVYVLGGYSASNNIGGTILTNPAGLPSIFLSKFRFQEIGGPLWTKAPGSDGPVSNAKVLADFNGDAYVAGSFQGTNLSFESTTLTNFGVGSDDVFIAKYNSAGTLQWVRQLGGTAADTFVGVDGGHFFSASGFYVGGEFESSTFSAGTTSLTRQGSAADCFVASYDFNGNLLWIKQGSNARMTCISADAANNCYVGGQTLGAAVFDSQSPSNPAGTNFLAKYDSSGNLQWVRGDVVIGRLLAIDPARNIYTAGTFSNSFKIGTTLLANPSPSTVFVAKYDPNGNFLWARQIPGRGADMVSGITIDLRNYCWVSGSFASPDQSNEPHAFMAALIPDGRCQVFDWTQQNGTSVASAMGTLYNWTLGAAADAFVCGSFSTNYSLGSLSVTNGGIPDVFVGWFIGPPELSSLATQTNLVLSWPTAGSQYFSIQSATDLGGGNWGTPTNTVYYVNGQFVITNSTQSGSGFFRVQTH